MSEINNMTDEQFYKYNRTGGLTMKYVIDVPDEAKWIQYIQQTGHGTINLKVESVSDLTPYTEPDEIKNNKVNLCPSCELYKEHFPECGDVNVLFGDGVGNDNICCCSGYVAKNEDEIRQKAHEEAWGLFGVIADMDYDDYEHCFGEDCEDWKFYKLSYQEAKAKYEEWRSRFVTINNKKYKIVKEGDGKCILEEI